MPRRLRPVTLNPVYFQVLGIGGAFTARYFNTAFFVNTPSFRLLIDGPPGLLRLLRMRQIPPESIDGVVLTHVHADHSGGMELYLLWRRYVMAQRTRLYTSGRVYAHLEQHLFGGFAETFTPDLTDVVGTRFDDYVEFCELAEDGVTRVAPELGLEIRHNWHPVPALGLKVHLGGQVIGISGDHCFRPQLLSRLRQSGRIDDSAWERMAGPWLWDSDLIYHEAAAGWEGGHTAEADLLRLPPEVRRRLRLVHVDDDFQGTLPVAVEGERAVVDRNGSLRLELPKGPEDS